MTLFRLSLSPPPPLLLVVAPPPVFDVDVDAVVRSEPSAVGGKLLWLVVAVLRPGLELRALRKPGR